MEAFSKLTRILKQFPAVGNKSAQRIALYLFSLPDKNLEEFVQAVKELKNDLKYCSICSNISKKDPCEICSDSDRDNTKVCVVADQKDLMAIEKTGVFKGVYHVLGGLISPIDGIYPEMLKINELMSRVKQKNFQEIIMAINPTVEGEATIIYLNKMLSKFELNVTRIAYGLPMGSDIDYVDESTVAQAVTNRVSLD